MNKDLKRDIEEALRCEDFVACYQDGDYIVSNPFSMSVFVDGGEITWDRKTKTVTSAGADPKLVEEIKEIVREL